MRNLLFIAALLVSNFAFAGQPLFGVGANMNFQMATSGREYQVATPFAIRAGYRFSFLDVIGEYSYIKSSSGTEMVSVSQSNNEFLLWGRKSFFVSRTFKPFAAAGLGSHYQVVTTKFGSQAEEDPGVFEVVGSLAAGFEVSFGSHVSWTFEGRGTEAESYSPNPLLGVASYLNVFF